MADFPDPDFPPVETKPFDPFDGDYAVQLKCPGFNQRNTFIIHPQMVHCPRLRTWKPTEFRIRQMLCSRVFTANVPIAKILCRSEKSSNGVVERLYRAPRNCKPRILPWSTTMRRNGICNIRTTSNSMIRMKAPTCLINSKEPPQLDLTSIKACIRKRVFQNDVHANHRNRNCRVTPIQVPTFKWACRNTIKAVILVEEIYGYSNLGRCKVSAIRIDIGPGQKTCFKPKITEYGGPRGTSRLGICRDYSSMILNIFGAKYCLRIHTINPNGFDFKVQTQPCRIMNLDGLYVGRRWRCGTVLLTIVDARVFGRVWGGRYQFNFFTRETGRMMGKTR